MKPKPVTPLMHGIIDYTFAAALLFVPSLLKVDKKIKWLHVMNAISVISYSAFTNYPAAIKRVIPLHFHKKLDWAALSLIALETLYKEIRKDKRAIVFQAAMLSAGIITVLLTDWEAKS